MSKEDVQRLLGSPDAVGNMSRKYREPSLFLYGSVELWFRQQKPHELTGIYPDLRKRGLGSAVLQHALHNAWEAGCYKVMLLTGSKTEATLRFYERAGFLRREKTGFVAQPPAG